ncbi:predicted protein [Nematostella vectensis]|uniref:Heme-binding protein 1 n=1 Tax=Nematostella vectensis TaxID=45351 RepID=A7SAG1_NEMVE|nr:predicted protein [Nematostella vectensis]|eukprot:XP_001631334.1 predicted protein [Nematostella vectensis]
MLSWFKGEEKPKPDPKKFHKPDFYHGSDGPEFRIIESFEGYEVRQYARSQWVSTKADPGEIMSAFWRLYGYINGKNDQSKKMSMNLPVRVHITLNENDTDGSNVKSCIMSFYISSEFLPEIPKPNDQAVFIEKDNSKVVYVCHFPGFAKEKDWKDTRKGLRQTLDKDCKRYATFEYYSMGYDPPYKLWGRRNEMVLVASHQPDLTDIVDEDEKVNEVSQ